jgi:pimeloyl-ACP methyl ester carboxylesterase
LCALRSGGGVALAEALAGPETWLALDRAHRDRLRVRSDFFAADVRAFLDWEPSSCGEPPARVVLTVGGRSAPVRHTTARLGERLGERVVVLDGCGHLPQLEAPGPFASVIRQAGLDLMSDHCGPELDRAAIAAPRRP